MTSIHPLLTLKKILAAIRVKDWWSYILPPIIGFYFLGNLLSDVVIISNVFIINLIQILLLSIPVAAFGFFVNEWTDIVDDKNAGKTNYAADLSPASRWLIFLLICSILFLEVKYLDLNPIIWIGVLFQLLLFIIYSVFPFRAKRNAIVAIFLDSLYSGPVFFIIAALLSGVYELSFFLAFFFSGWLKGIRNIIFHFIADKQFDAKIGQKTIAHLLDVRHLYQYQMILWWIEMIILLGLVYCASGTTFYIFLGGFILLLLKRLSFTIRKLDIEQRIALWLPELNIMYEFWLPVSALAGLMAFIATKEFVITFVIFFIVFPNSFRQILQQLKAVYFLISDIYFIRIKPYFDIGKFFRGEKN